MPGKRRFDRDAALVAALHAFWRWGYRGTSMATLTETMGVHPPSIYGAFGDKRTLFDEATALYVAQLHRGVERLLASDDTREALAGVLRAAADAHTDPATPPGCLVLSEPLLDDERERLRAAIAERIRRGVAEGGLPASVAPDALARYLMTVMIGMSSLARDGADRDEITGVVEQTIAMLPAPVAA